MRYALQRIAQLILVFVIVTFCVLVAMRIGGGGADELARRMLGGTVTDQQVADTVRRYHLDQNYVVQYLYWLKGFVTFDLGFSVANSMKVSRLLAPRAWTTILLGLYAIGFGLMIAVPLAVMQAHRRDSWLDRIGNTVSFVGVGVPAVVLGIFVQLLVAKKLGWFAAVGTSVYPWQDLSEHIHNFALPVLTLVIPQAAIFTRLLRADMVATLQSDFITLASAKGMPTRRILWRHALRNSMLSIVTSVGTSLGGLLGGAVVVENLFDLDGIGSQLIVSVLSRDLFTVQACVAFVVFIVVVVNLLVDLSYALIDPRVARARAT